MRKPNPKSILDPQLNQIWLNFGWQLWRVQDAFWIRPAQFLLVFFRFQARSSCQNSYKNSSKFGSILDDHLGGSRPLLGFGCAFLADVVQVSSQKSAFKIRTKIQPNLVQFWVTILAGPGCFLDAACDFFADVVQVSSQKSANNQIWFNCGLEFWRVQDAIWIRPAHCLLMLSSFQARNQPSEFAQKFNQIWLIFGWQFWRGPGRFMDSACALLADVVLVASHKSAFKIRTKIQPNLVEFWVAIWRALFG